MKKEIIIFILGGIFFSCITAYAAYKYNASEIGYEPENENFDVENVEEAINYLYDKYQKDMELTLGETYEMGGYEWIAAEKIVGGYVMQSTGMTAGTWPGYKLTGNYGGTKSYGNANNYYDYDIDGDNIANYDSVTSTFYTNWKSVELTTAMYGKGLFLISNAKAGSTSTDYRCSSGDYYCVGLGIAATQGDKLGTNIYGCCIRGAYLGTQKNSDGYNGVWGVLGYNNGEMPKISYNVMSGSYQQKGNHAIAPAFNLDASKVYLDGTTIKKKEN